MKMKMFGLFRYVFDSFLCSYTLIISQTLNLELTNYLNHIFYMLSESQSRIFQIFYRND